MTTKNDEGRAVLFTERILREVRDAGPLDPVSILPVIRESFPEITPGALRLLHHLARRAHVEEDRRGLVVLPLPRALAFEVGSGIQTLERHLGELRTTGLVRRVLPAERGKGGEGAVYWIPCVESGRTMQQAANRYAKGVRT